MEIQEIYENHLTWMQTFQIFLKYYPRAIEIRKVPRRTVSVRHAWKLRHEKEKSSRDILRIPIGCYGKNSESIRRWLRIKIFPRHLLPRCGLSQGHYDFPARDTSTNTSDFPRPRGSSRARARGRDTRRKFAKLSRRAALNGTLPRSLVA